MLYHSRQKSVAAQQRDGAMLPIIAVVMIFLFIAASLGVDIARMHVTRSELRTATDAAARAAVEALGREQNAEAAIDAAVAIANMNRVAGIDLTIERSDVILGTAELQADGTFAFSENAGRGGILNAVRVNGRRTADSPDGNVGLLFGPLFGVTDFDPVQTAVAARSDRDIGLVLDVSLSMKIDNRFGALQNALDVFLGILDATPQDEAVALTVYSTTDRQIQPVTQDFELVRNAFAAESPNGNTAIGRGLATGLDSIQNDPGSRPFALKSMVVMTDGQHNTGVSPDVIALEAAAQGITVHTVTFSDGANQDLMREVAESTGGTHLHAETNEELVEAFELIARQLAVLLIE